MLPATLGVRLSARDGLFRPSVAFGYLAFAAVPMHAVALYGPLATLRAVHAVRPTSHAVRRPRATRFAVGSEAMRLPRLKATSDALITCG